MLSALKCQHQFTPGTNLKAWLFTIVRNKFLSAVSRKHVTAEVHEEDLERRHWVAPEQESRIEVLAFKRAFKTLSLVHREVLVLAVVQGLPYAEIALLCGCEVGTVKSRANRARAALKHLLLDDAGRRPHRQGRLRPRRLAGEPAIVERCWLSIDAVVRLRQSRGGLALPLAVRHEARRSMDETWQQRVRERAYVIWQHEGSPDGSAEQFWLMAEEELLAKGQRPSSGPAEERPDRLCDEAQ